MSSYVPDSNLKQIKKLQRQVDTLSDMMLFGLAVNDTAIIYANTGARDAAHGPAAGLESNAPITHPLQDLITPGTFDTIKASATNVVVDLAASAVLNLKWVQGVFNDGVKIILQSPLGKTLNILTGGSFAIPSAYALTDQDIAIAQYDKTMNQFKVIKTGGGGSGSTLWSAITIDTAKNMGGFGLSNLDYVAFNPSITQYINGTPTTLDYDTPTGTVHNFKINAVTKITINSIGMALNSGIITGVTEMDFTTAGMNLSASGSVIHYNTPSGGTHRFNVNAVQKVTITNTALNLSGIFLEFGAATRTIFQSSGLVYDVPTGETHTFRINGVTDFQIGPVAVDVFGSSIINVSGLNFANAGQVILSQPSGISILVPTGDTIQYLINGVLKLAVTNTFLNVQTEITMNSNIISGCNGISFVDSSKFIDDVSNTLSLNVGAGQTIIMHRNTIPLLLLGANTTLRSDGVLQLMVTGAGDSIVFNDGSSDRLTYDWSTDDFYPVDGQSNLGRATNRWNTVYALNGTINTSFTRFKKDIKPVTPSDCLAIVLAMPPIKYRMKYDEIDWKDSPKKKETLTKVHFGFAADALERLMPEACQGDGIYQNSVIAALLGAVQELKKKIDVLEQKL